MWRVVLAAGRAAGARAADASAHAEKGGAKDKRKARGAMGRGPRGGAVVVDLVAAAGEALRVV